MMAKFNISCFLFLFIPLLVFAGVPFEDCGSAFYLESIIISGCETYPCHLKIGSTVTVTTNLLIRGTTFDSNDLEQRVYFVVSKILLEVQVFPDPCSAVRGSNQTSCELRIGERITYEVIINVQDVPPLPATLYWTIKNKDTEEQMVCYRMTVILTE